MICCRKGVVDWDSPKVHHPHVWTSSWVLQRTSSRGSNNYSQDGNHWLQKYMYFHCRCLRSGQEWPSVLYLESASKESYMRKYIKCIYLVRSKNKETLYKQIWLLILTTVDSTVYDRGVMCSLRKAKAFICQLFRWVNISVACPDLVLYTLPTADLWLRNQPRILSPVKRGEMKM